MRAAARVAGALGLSALLLPVCGFTPDALHAPEAALIVTAAREFQPQAALTGKDRFPQGAHLLRWHEGKSEELLADFAASADANISFDGERLLFAGKKNAGDPWQIYEYTFMNGKVRKLVASKDDLIRPFYLPGGRVVYAHRFAEGFQLEVAGEDGLPVLLAVPDDAGAHLQRISFFPGNAIPDDVLADGRILFETNFPIGTGTTPEEMLVYSDGSGLESYRCDHQRARFGGHQLSSGDVIFTHGNSLARFHSASSNEVAVKAPLAQYAGAIAETDKGTLLVSAKNSSPAHYAVKLWRDGAATMQSLIARADEDVVEPVMVAQRLRPNRHPSGLHAWNYANLLVLDARLSRAGDLQNVPAMVRLESLDQSGKVQVNGEAPIESDGSFFIKVPGDRAIRMSLIDAQGKVIRAEQGWRWIRSGEQRICVGCHTGPERSGENRVPAVLLRSTTPADLTASATSTSAQGGK